MFQYSLLLCLKKFLPPLIFSPKKSPNMTQLEDLSDPNINFDGEERPRYNDGVDLNAVQHKLIHDMTESVLFSKPQTKRSRPRGLSGGSIHGTNLYGTGGSFGSLSGTGGGHGGGHRRAHPMTEDELAKGRRQYLDRYYDITRDLKLNCAPDYQFGLAPNGHKTLGQESTEVRHRPEAGNMPKEEE